MLKLKNLAECSGLSGGAAIELLAKRGDPMAFPLTPVMPRTANCDFSFSGIKEAIKRIIKDEETKHGNCTFYIIKAFYTTMHRHLMTFI